MKYHNDTSGSEHRMEDEQQQKKETQSVMRFSLQKFIKSFYITGNRSPHNTSPLEKTYLKLDGMPVGKDILPSFVILFLHLLY